MVLIVVFRGVGRYGRSRMAINPYRRELLLEYLAFVVQLLQLQDRSSSATFLVSIAIARVV
jgi:hypothetical protein